MMNDHTKKGHPTINGNALFVFGLAVMTTGGAGGLITPYKGIVTDTP